MDWENNRKKTQTKPPNQETSHQNKPTNNKTITSFLNRHCEAIWMIFSGKPQHSPLLNTEYLDI